MQSVRYNFDGKNADLPLKPIVDMLFAAARPHWTERQYEVIALHWQGLSGKDIAARLYISQSTVSRLLGKAEKRVREAVREEEQQNEHGRDH